MKFIDTAEISVIGGHGGSGSSSFRHEKYVPKGGPDGGDGGQGGHIIFQGTENLQSLMDLKLKYTYKAQAGQAGQSRKKHGCDGKDCIIKVPFGTLIFDESGLLLCDITPLEPRFIAAKGGKGGKGNTHFATSRNQAPKYFQSGLPGEQKQLKLELRLIAEVGLVGLPNAGKSTLLKKLTNASPKIADYPFTTLYPNLGRLDFYNKEILLADIPGLIEGASSGTGLGHDFLRHIDRTTLLLHLVPCANSVEETLKSYTTIVKELEKSDYHLEKKPTIILLSKTDTISVELETEILAAFELKGVSPLPISSFTGKNINELIQQLYSHSAFKDTL